MQATIRFHPIEPETLRLLTETWDELGDPVDCYSRLISAAMVAAAILGLEPEKVSGQAEGYARQAARAVAERTEIFGSFGGGEALMPDDIRPSRDELAMRAMAAIISTDSVYDNERHENRRAQSAPNLVARNAYAFADAMLHARGGPAR